MPENDYDVAVLAVALLITLGVYGALGVMMWLHDVWAYYFVPMHRIRYGKPRFWPWYR